MFVELSEKDFTGNVLDTYKNNKVMILFKAEWCGYCKQFMPVFTELSKNYRGDVIFAVIDIDANKELLMTINSFLYGYKVQGFPTVVMYNNGYYEETYQGPRTINNLVNYLNTF